MILQEHVRNGMVGLLLCEMLWLAVSSYRGGK